MDAIWSGPTRFTIDGVDFACSFAPSTDDLLCVRKPKPLVHSTLRLLAAEEPRRIVEFGIASGGSTALLALAARPERMVACELAPERVVPLDRVLARAGLTESVVCHYGVDQGERDGLGPILDDALGDAAIDLVVDDASHRLIETRACFETEFPRLRPGGVYVIEDWCWQSRLAHAVAHPDRPRPTPPDSAVEGTAAGTTDLGDYVRANTGLRPLAALTLELVLVRACSDGVIDELVIDEHWVVVRRGRAPVDADGFALADHYTDRDGLLGVP